MRKHVSFAIAATLLVLAVVFWSISGVVQTTASFGRSKAPTYRVIQVPSRTIGFQEHRYVAAAKAALPVRSTDKTAYGPTHIKSLSQSRLILCAAMPVMQNSAMITLARDCSQCAGVVSCLGVRTHNTLGCSIAAAR
jgi:hypothetical protein